MMKKTILFLITTTLILNVYAQNDVVNIKLNDIEITQNTYNYPHYDVKNDIFTFSFLEGKDLTIQQFSSNGDKKLSSAYKLDKKGLRIIETKISAQNMSYLLTNSRRTFLQYVIYDVKDQTWKPTENLLTGTQKLIGNYNYDANTYILNFVSDNEEFELNVLDNLELKKVKSFGYNDNEWALKFLKSSDKHAKFKSITTESPNDLYAARKKFKSYQFKSKVYLIMDDSSSTSTEILMFDLKQKSFTSKTITTNTTCENNTYNLSTATQNHLVKIAGCKDAAELSVWDIQSGTKLTTQQLEVGKSMDFKSYDNIIRTNKKAQSIEVVKTKQLLQTLEMKPHSASIFAIQSDDNIEIQLGYVIKKPNRYYLRASGEMKKGGSGDGSGGGMGGGAGGGKAKDGDSELEYKSGRTNAISKSFIKYFETNPYHLVCNYNSTDNHFVKKNKESNSFDKIIKFKKQNDLGFLKGELLIPISNDSFWYGYLNKDRTELIINRMNKD